MDHASTKTSARPAFGNGPVARVVVAFVLGAFVVLAFNAYQQQAREYEAAPASVKQGCAGRIFSNYRNCVLREDAARRAAER